MNIPDELVGAFVEFNDAAIAMSHCQLAQASAASERLEKSRKAFHTLFMQTVQASAVEAHKQG
jgi:hypothetical protein